MDGGAVGHNIEMGLPKDYPFQVWFNLGAIVPCYSILKRGLQNAHLYVLLSSQCKIWGEGLWKGSKFQNFDAFLAHLTQRVMWAVLNKSKRINIQKFNFFLISFLYVKNSNSYMIFSIINFSKRNFHKEFIKKNSLKKMNNIRKHSFCTLGPFLWQRAWIWGNKKCTWWSQYRGKISYLLFWSYIFIPKKICGRSMLWVCLRLPSVYAYFVW
jgi:hypothetical protein